MLETYNMQDNWLFFLVFSVQLKLGCFSCPNTGTAQQSYVVDMRNFIEQHTCRSEQIVLGSLTCKSLFWSQGPHWQIRTHVHSLPSHLFTLAWLPANFSVTLAPFDSTCGESLVLLGCWLTSIFTVTSSWSAAVLSAARSSWSGK